MSRSQCFVLSDSPTIEGYLLAALVPEAQIFTTCPDQAACEDRLVIFHTDRTYTHHCPDGRRSFAFSASRTGAVVWNAFATDISKRRVQQTVERLRLPSLAIAPGSGADLVVIVKSNENCGGLPESRVAASQTAVTAVHQVAGIKNYLIAPLGEIDEEMKRHPQVVMERYVTNPDGLFMRAYRSGSRMAVSVSSSAEPIKRMGFGQPRLTSYHEVPFDEAHPSQVASEGSRQAFLVMSALGLNFGAGDLVVDERGGVHVCDINTTPFWEETEPEIEDFLRAGILSA